MQGLFHNAKALNLVGNYSTLMANVTVYDTRLLHVEVMLDDELTLDIVKAHNQMSLEYLGEGVYDVLFDVQEVSLLRVPNNVLRYWAERNDYSRFVGKMAILVKSKTHMQLANFYIRFFKPVNPSRFFTEKANALSWIYGG
jgi:hypothetical protein